MARVSGWYRAKKTRRRGIRPRNGSAPLLRMLARSFCAFQAGSSRGRARVHGSLARGQLAAGAGAWVVVLRAAPGVRPTPLLAETLAKDRVAQPRERQGPLPSVRTGPYGREGPLSGAMPGPAAPGSGPVLGRGPSCAARAASLSVICGVPPFSLIFSQPTRPLFRSHHP